MAQDLDLLGDPIPENWGRRGRPPHIPTQENRNKVIVLLALDWEEIKIAKALGITDKTLRKHYFRELKVKDEARARLEAAAVLGVTAKAVTGDVPAYRELRKVMDRADQRDTDRALRGPAPAPTAARLPQLGKKEQRLQAAESVGGVYAPGAPPSKAQH